MSCKMESGNRKRAKCQVNQFDLNGLHCVAGEHWPYLRKVVLLVLELVEVFGGSNECPAMPFCFIISQL